MSIQVKVWAVKEFSSESLNHRAENLLINEEEVSWKCDQWQRYHWVVIELSEKTYIDSIELLNKNSAFIEIFVSNSNNRDFGVLLPVSSLLSPSKSKNESHSKNNNFIFKSKSFTLARRECWKFLKFVCSQPFNKNIQFGLSNLKIFTDTNKQRPYISVETEYSLGKFKLKNQALQDGFSNYNIGYQKGFYHSIKSSKLKYSNNDEKNTNNTQKDKNNFIPNLKTVKKEKEIESSNDLNTKSKFNSLKQNKKNVINNNEIEDKSKISVDILSLKNKPSTSKNLQPNGLNLKLESESTKKKKKKSKSFDQIMSDVVIVLSGYKNPLRSELRDKALAMGAKYEKNWNFNCTHLICAYSNTPKYIEVHNLNGRIVSEKWIEESYTRKKLLEWRDFMIGTYQGPDTPPDSGQEFENDSYNKASKMRKCHNDVESNSNEFLLYDSDVIYNMDTEPEED